MKRLPPSPDPAIRGALSPAYWKTATQIAAETHLPQRLVSARLRMIHANEETDRQPSPEGFQYRWTARRHDRRQEEDAVA
jgi:hypothetical protein